MSALLSMTPLTMIGGLLGLAIISGMLGLGVAFAAVPLLYVVRFARRLLLPPDKANHNHLSTTQP